MRIKRFGFVLLALALVLATAIPASARPNATQKIAVVDFGFAPQRTRVHAGDTVIWKNIGRLVHTTTSQSGLWDADLNPGDTYEYTFLTPGTYDYYCDIHEFMRARIVVVQ